MNNVCLLIQLSRIAAIILAIISIVIYIYDYYWTKATVRQIDIETFLTVHGQIKETETDYRECWKQHIKDCYTAFYRKYWKQHIKNCLTALVLIIVALLLYSIQFIPKVRIYEIARQEMIQEHKLGNNKERQQIDSVKTLIFKYHESN